MIRLETETEWLLLPHAEHAALAGEFARHWKNRAFAPPDPFAHVLDAVSRHDDSWTLRDTTPTLTPDGHPAAFSRELVGTYDAFEDIDLAAYLGVRGEATESAARRDPYSAILISMHTVNLLTEQADLSGLDSASRALHGQFIDGQRRRQQELTDRLRSERPELAPFLEPAALQRGFRFLQACDSFSLLAGVDFPQRAALRHPQPRLDGSETEIAWIPLGEGCVRLDPWPLDEPALTFDIPYRHIPKSAMRDLQCFQAAYAAAPVTPRRLLVTGEMP